MVRDVALGYRRPKGRAIRLAARAIGCGQYARALMGKVLRDAGHSRVGGDFPPTKKTSEWQKKSPARGRAVFDFPKIRALWGLPGFADRILWGGSSRRPSL